MSASPVPGSESLSQLSAHLRRTLGDARVLVTDFLPVPLADVRGRDAFFATTAPTAIATAQAQHLEAAYGVRIVGSSARLADRAGLAEDLETAGGYDVLLTELKAAAVDVACRHAAARGADVVFVDNRAEVTEGSTDLATAFGEVIDLAIARGMARGANPREGPADERTNEDVPDRDLRSRAGVAVLKGLLASQVMVTGLSPYRAYQVAEEVGDPVCWSDGEPPSRRPSWPRSRSR